MSIQDRPHKLTPSVGETWLLRNDKAAIITAVEKHGISGNIITKLGLLGAEWNRYGIHTDQQGFDLIEKCI